MKFSSEQLEDIAGRLRSLPPVDIARTHSKQDAVQLLGREIAELRKRGYTLDQVADALRDGGLEISTPTLKNYLHRAKKLPRKRSRGAGVPNRKATGKQARSTSVKAVVNQAATFDPTPDSDDI